MTRRELDREWINHRLEEQKRRLARLRGEE